MQHLADYKMETCTMCGHATTQVTLSEHLPQVTASRSLGMDTVSTAISTTAVSGQHHRRQMAASDAVVWSATLCNTPQHVGTA